jgi:hypothetical protein
MDRKKIIAGISLLTITGVIIYLWRRQRIHAVNQLKAEQVAEEGYETAHDVLFPNQRRRIKRYRYPRH